MKRFSGSPAAPANTTARPIGCPQSNVAGAAAIPGRSGASALSPRTRNPPRRTRSPCGPHANGPGSRTGNRQLSVSVVGSSAQARPPDTNATVWDGSDGPLQPLGSGLPSARTAAVGAGMPPGVPAEVAGGAVGGALGVPWVHAPTRKETARIQRSVRMPMFDGTPVARRVRGAERSQDRSQRCHDLFGDVEVGVDVLDIVELLQRVDQLQYVASLATLDGDRRAGHQ